MQLHPTRSTFHVAFAGVAMVALGIAAKLAAVVAFGGAILLAVGVGRALALVAVTRLRAAGFEMVWATGQRVARTARGGEVIVEAELRNRGVDDVRGVAIRPISASTLDVEVVPSVCDLPAGSRVRVELRIRARRVGRWGLHGLALEVRGTPAGGEGLYEVPLLFANPFGIEVLPRALHVMVQSPRGGRSRRASEIGRPSNVAGEGDELRELREHVPGDPFKRIAWKASAKRGQLVVREMEREERDIVWLVLDASVELWAGPEGRAPLDEGVEEIASLAARHLKRGDHVGLVIAASRPRAWIDPDGGPAHASRLAAALAGAASMVDSDRSELDEPEIAQRVAEHLRPLDPRGLTDVPKGDLDALARRAEALKPRAPFAPRVPFARTPRDQALRHYLAAFGVEVPPRVDGEREKTEATLAHAFEKLATLKPRPSIVHVWAPAPSRGGPLVAALRAVRSRRIEIRWSLPPFEASIGDAKAGAPKSVREAVEEAVRVRARASRERGHRMLRQLGVHKVSVGHPRVDPDDPHPEQRAMPAAEEPPARPRGAA